VIKVKVNQDNFDQVKKSVEKYRKEKSRLDDYETLVRWINEGESIRIDVAEIDRVIFLHGEDAVDVRDLFDKKIEKLKKELQEGY
jgi:hypothetical protein